MNLIVRTTSATRCLEAFLTRPSSALKSLELVLLKRTQPVRISSSLLLVRHKHDSPHRNDHEQETIDNNTYNPDSFFEGIPPKKVQKFLDDEKKYNGKLVYVGRLTSQLFTAKTLSLSSSLLGLGLLPFLGQTLASSSLFSQVFVYGTTCFFIFVTPMFAQFLTRRYVSRLYYNYDEKRFKAVMLSFLMTEYKYEFALDDVHVPDLPGVFTTVQVKSSKRNLFVDLNTIADVGLVQKIYGYDKPFDIKKYTDEEKK